MPSSTGSPIWSPRVVAGGGRRRRSRHGVGAEHLRDAGFAECDRAGARRRSRHRRNRCQESAGDQVASLEKSIVLTAGAQATQGLHRRPQRRLLLDQPLGGGGGRSTRGPQGLPTRSEADRTISNSGSSLVAEDGLVVAPCRRPDRRCAIPGRRCRSPCDEQDQARAVPRIFAERVGVEHGRAAIARRPWHSNIASISPSASSA